LGAELLDGRGISMTIECLLITVLLLGIVANINGWTRCHVSDPCALNGGRLFVSRCGCGRNFFSIGLGRQEFGVGTGGSRLAAFLDEAGGDNDNVSLADFLDAESREGGGGVDNDAFEFALGKFLCIKG